jgi:hypothetical protein
MFVGGGCGSHKEILGLLVSEALPGASWRRGDFIISS